MVYYIVCVFVFFFKQKTAYEVRISDWSSDVCSSDLQAKIFNESTVLNGIILTKMDGTGKGGIVFAITRELNIPIAFISFGEKLDEVKLFNTQEYVEDRKSVE